MSLKKYIPEIDDGNIKKIYFNSNNDIDMTLE